MIEKMIILGLVFSGVITAFSKLGVLEWLQLKSPKLLSKLFSCAFCMAFWLSFITAGYWTHDFLETICIAFGSASIARYL
jgi:hypothetical protein